MKQAEDGRTKHPSLRPGGRNPPKTPRATCDGTGNMRMVWAFGECTNGLAKIYGTALTVTSEH